MSWSIAGVKTVGLVVKKNHRDAASLAAMVARYFLRRKIKVFFSEENSDSLAILGRKLENAKTLPKQELADQSDFILVFGGDGTFVSIARMIKKRSVPILGVNMGTLGFLTEIRKDEIFEVLNQIFEEGQITLSERILFQAEVVRNGKVILDSTIVNDLVIAKGAIARIIGMKISIDGAKVSHFRADGIILSTPTGSTAYSLAAGGPIVVPSMQAVILTPICPFGLTQRPLVISDRSEIVVQLDQKPGTVFLTLDGQEVLELSESDEIRLSRFKKHPLRMVSSPDRDYFTLLREKLSYGSRL